MFLSLNPTPKVAKKIAMKGRKRCKRGQIENNKFCYCRNRWRPHWRKHSILKLNHIFFAAFITHFICANVRTSHIFLTFYILSLWQSIICIVALLQSIIYNVAFKIIFIQYVQYRNHLKILWHVTRDMCFPSCPFLS